MVNHLDAHQIWASIESVGPDTVVLLVANPVDVLTAVFQRISGLPAERVIGTGTFLDSMRLRRQLSLLTGVAASAIHAYVVGEHGDLQVTNRTTGYSLNFF